MSTWLAALKDLHTSATPAVLVTVATSQGSTPREAGARMVYTASDQYDTIGGGHLEWRAAQIARAMLDADPVLPAACAGSSALRSARAWAVLRRCRVSRVRTGRSRARTEYRPAAQCAGTALA